MKLVRGGDFSSFTTEELVAGYDFVKSWPASFDDLMANAVAKSPLKRLVTLTEIANLCAFLCTDASSGMTGQCLVVDAGMGLNYFDQAIVSRVVG